MAKKRTLNEIRQEKNYGYRTPNLNGDHGEEIVDSNTDIEAIKSMIVDKITRQFSDTLFETVCEHMSDHSVFQSQTYLTEEGYEEFEDEWFEFYHEHHGDILHEVTQNITN